MTLPYANSMELTINAPRETSIWPQGVGAEAIWEEIIATSRDDICIALMYMASPGGTAVDRIVDGLLLASGRGVSVNISIDQHVFERNLQSNDRWYVDPVHRLTSESRISFNLDLNRRDRGGILHAKLLSSDGAMVWIGSNNLDWRAFEHIFEIGLLVHSRTLVRMVGPLLSSDGDLGSVELRTLNQTGVPVDFRGLTHQVSLTASPRSPSLDEAFDCWIRLRNMMNGAQSEILISSRKMAELSRDLRSEPWSELSDCLSQAVSRGVRVRILVDEYQLRRPSDLDFIRSLSYLNGLECRVVRVPEHSSGFIPHARMHHAKFVIVDSMSSWIGSNNITQDDFLRAKNFGFVVQGRGIACALKELFVSLWSSALASDF